MMKKYYICVTPFFPSPTNWRGAYVYDQVKAIQRNSDYDVLVFSGARTKGEYETNGVKVYQYKTMETPSNVLNGIFNGYNSKSFVSRVLELGINPDDVAYVHCHVSMRAACGLALKKLNPQIKVLLQHHDLDPFNLRSGVIGRYNWINIQYRARTALKLYNQVDMHICISEACRDSLIAFPNARRGEVYEDYLRVISKAKGVGPVKLKNTYVLYNGVDTTLFNRYNEKDVDQKGKDQKFRIGCIANFNDLKGHMTLIKAFHILYEKGYNNIILSLLGTGETKEDCVRYLNDNNLMQYVEWPSEVTHDKLPDYYRSLDLFVLPSYFEGFGCVYTEAAACGVPFMGCVNQGYSEYIADADRWLIKPHDHEQLAKLIANYYQAHEEQDLVYPYDIDELIRAYLITLEKLG